MPTTRDQWYRLVKSQLEEIVELLDRTHVIVGRSPRITIDNSQVTATLSSILSQLELIEPSVDGLEALITSTNALITSTNALVATDGGLMITEWLSLIKDRLETVDGNTINEWLKLIESDTGALVISNAAILVTALLNTGVNTTASTELIAINALIVTTNALLTTIDTVLDGIDVVLDNALIDAKRKYPIDDAANTNMVYLTVTMANRDLTKDIVAASTSLMEMESIDIKSTDTAARTMDIRHYDGANSVNLMRISLAAGADLKYEDLTTNQQSILKHLRIDSGIKMRCIASGLTAGKTIKVETMWTRIRGSFD